MKHYRYYLLIIVCLAAFFRFYRLGDVPPSPSLDEASIAYNAYSILETGRDEYGTRFPLLLRAFDDWRPAAYVYLVIPFVKLFGLSALAVRFPAALLGTLTVILTFYLVKELFSSAGQKPSFMIHNSLFISLLSAFLLAISPWHIYLSRLGHEVNLGLTLTVVAVYYFLKSSRLSIIPAAIFFALSFYAYQSQKIFGPVLLLAILLIFYRKLWERRRLVFVSFGVLVLLLIPIVNVSLAPQALSRFQGTSLLSNHGLEAKVAARGLRDQESGNWIGSLLDNRRVSSLLAVGNAYFSHFDPAWLFFNSDREKHKIPNLGLFYLWELPLLVVGLYQLGKENYDPKLKYFLIAWLLAAPLPAAITTEAPHAMRAFNALPVPQILSAIGAVTLFRKTKLSMLGLPLVAFSLIFLLHNYFVNFPYEQSDSFQYPLGRAIEYTLKRESEYERIVITNQNQGYQSYMFYLYYRHYDPHLYLAQGGTKSGGYNQTHQIGKYEFRPINWSGQQAGTLFVGNTGDFPDGIVGADFKLLTGENALKAISGGK